MMPSNRNTKRMANPKREIHKHQHMQRNQRNTLWNAMARPDVINPHRGRPEFVAEFQRFVYIPSLLCKLLI